jgi:replicative DNA helicase
MTSNELALQSTPPHDLEAEQSLLGLMMINNKILDDVADVLKPDFFYDPRNKVVYKIMLDLWSENNPIDIIYILNQVPKTKYADNLSKEQTIDRNFLVDLVSKSSLSASGSSTAKIIKNQFLLRTIVETSDRMRGMALDRKSTPEDILDEAQKSLFEASLENSDKNFIPISSVLGQTFERISDLYHNQVEFRGIPTGFTDLDKILGGLHNSDLVILAARPSMGKTALSLEFARRIAMQQQVGVAIFSLEMGKEQLVDRLVASVSGVDSWKIRTGKFSEDPNNNEFMKLGKAIGELDQAPIWIDDSGGLNILELRSKARRLKSRHNVGVIIIDYLQLMNSGSNRYGGNRVQEVSEISRGLKLLAKELNIPVLALSQLSRSVEGRDDKKPMLSDLRESGSIEQDADVVMFVHRDEMYNRESKKKGIADIIISKHRNGSTGMIELAWVGRLATFENLDGARVTKRTNE